MRTGQEGRIKVQAALLTYVFLFLKKTYIFLNFLTVSSLA